MRDRIALLTRQDQARRNRSAFLASLMAVSLMGCSRPAETRSYPLWDGDLSYRVDLYRGDGPLSPNSTVVFAVFQTKAGHDEKLVLSGTDLDIKSVSWEAGSEGVLCLSGGYTETYRRTVALSVASRTKPVYTHLSDRC